MSLRRIALVAGVLWIARQALARPRARAAGPSAMPAAPDRREPVGGVGALDAESPNEGERLQARGIGRAAGEGDDDLFGSTPQEGASARAPGLPDFFRGA